MKFGKGRGGLGCLYRKKKKNRPITQLGKFIGRGHVIVMGRTIFSYFRSDRVSTQLNSHLQSYYYFWQKNYLQYIYIFWLYCPTPQQQFLVNGIQRQNQLVYINNMWPSILHDIFIMISIFFNTTQSQLSWIRDIVLHFHEIQNWLGCPFMLNQIQRK